jgi:hypothetical protein
LEKGGVVVSLEPHTSLTRREQARLTAEARRFGRFLETPVEVRVV